MNESVLKEFVQQGIHMQVLIQEAFPIKGKPAQKNLGSKTVYIVKIVLGGKGTLLESARGGPREWASLDKLAKWLKLFGIRNYTITHADSQVLLQQSLFLNGANN